MAADGTGGSLWLGRDEARAVASALLPKQERAKEEVEKLLFEVVTLEVRRVRAVWATPTL